ncbi:diacylglycerol kinase [Thermodesulfovibrionales bacterium]|nr:diacylglycerol kinase [Thermodesulfovibrionales bacterium]MCL0107180.1 diacylglycerol kinase [Thermodesulfovibrionales bacterium]
MSFKKWIRSANNAIEGILHAAKTQRHLRYHLVTAAAVLVLSFVLGINKTEFMIISIAIILVLFAEMINTAIEYVVDIVSPEQSEKARMAKDVAAGAVLITAFGAVVLGCVILFPYLSRAFETGIYIVKHSEEDIALISVIIVLILVVVLKAYFGRGHPLRGGMPSGHAAIAFSVWMTITYVTESFIASLLCFMLAIIIAQSRVMAKIHTPLEATFGAVIGAGITFVLFSIFG